MPWRSKNKEIEVLRGKIEELKSRLPAHSVKPHMMQELESLEDKLDTLLKRQPP